MYFFFPLYFINLQKLQKYLLCKYLKAKTKVYKLKNHKVLVRQPLKCILATFFNAEIIKLNLKTVYDYTMRYNP